MRNLPTLALTLSLTTAPAVTWAQHSTLSQTVTLTGDELAEVVTRACGEARALADEADGLRVQRDTIRAQRDQCVGALTQWRGLDAQRLELMRQLAKSQFERESRVDRVWVVVGIVAGLVLGGVGGWIAGRI